MARVLLIRGDATLAARLRRAGHSVRALPRASPELLRALAHDRPDAVAIALERAPAEAAAVATHLRQRAATRGLPLVFLGGTPDALARIRALLPDAVFDAEGRAASAVRRALRARRATPVVPGTMDAYAGVSLPRKLGVRCGARVRLLEAPQGFAASLKPLPDGARLLRARRDAADVVVLFARSPGQLEHRFPAALQALATGGRLWLAWRKRAAGGTLLSPAVVRAFALARGLVDYKIAALDATWSGLCFARRAAGARGAQAARRRPARDRAGAASRRERRR